MIFDNLPYEVKFWVVVLKQVRKAPVKLRNSIVDFCGSRVYVGIWHILRSPSISVMAMDSQSIPKLKATSSKQQACLNKFPSFSKNLGVPLSLLGLSGGLSK